MFFEYGPGWCMTSNGHRFTCDAVYTHTRRNVYTHREHISHAHSYTQAYIKHTGMPCPYRSRTVAKALIGYDILSREASKDVQAVSKHLNCWREHIGVMQFSGS